VGAPPVAAARVLPTAAVLVGGPTAVLPVGVLRCVRTCGCVCARVGVWTLFCRQSSSAVADCLSRLCAACVATHQKGSSGALVTTGMVFPDCCSDFARWSRLVVRVLLNDSCRPVRSALRRPRPIGAAYASVLDGRHGRAPPLGSVRLEDTLACSTFRKLHACMYVHHGTQLHTHTHKHRPQTRTHTHTHTHTRTTDTHLHRRRHAQDARRRRRHVRSLCTFACAHALSRLTCCLFAAGSPSYAAPLGDQQSPSR
jgi:hypothetical protein